MLTKTGKILNDGLARSLMDLVTKGLAESCAFEYEFVLTLWHWGKYKKFINPQAVPHIAALGEYKLITALIKRHQRTLYVMGDLQNDQGQ